MTHQKLYAGEKQLSREVGTATSISSEVSLKIYQGALNGRTQYIVEIADNTGTNPVYYKYADLLNSEGKIFTELKNDLMNQFAFSRRSILKIQQDVENFKNKNRIEKINEAQTRLLLGVVVEPNLEQLEKLSTKRIEQYYNDILSFIRDNVEFFPQRNLSWEIKENEGYIEGESFGVFIKDELGLRLYSEEVIAISPKYVQELVSKNTTEFANIIKRFIELGYFIDSYAKTTGNLKQIKLRHKLISKRMYLVRIDSSVKMGYES